MHREASIINPRMIITFYSKLDWKRALQDNEAKLQQIVIANDLILCRFSQIPDFGHLWWLSYVAALMSFGYVSFQTHVS